MQGNNFGEEIYKTVGEGPWMYGRNFRPIKVVGGDIFYKYMKVGINERMSNNLSII